MDEKEIENYRGAGKIAKEVIAYARGFIKSRECC